ncbi:sodium:solute symporter family protein [Salinisphaera japonica]|nr:sodium:solute symporter family protein [Salinisphaera japonica]
MSTQMWIYLAVGSSFLLYFVIAIVSRAGSTDDFYRAGGNIGPVANGMATAADWMSAASFISMAGLIAFLGYNASPYLMGWTGGFVLLALLLAPYLRKYGSFTVPAFIGERYYSNVARSVAILCLIIASTTYVIGQMKGVGVAFGRFLEVEFETGVFIGMAVVFVYSVLGGMKGITYTQIAQYVVLIFAFTVPAIFISIELTGIPLPQIGLGSTMSDGSGVYLLEKLNATISDLGFDRFTNPEHSTVNIFLLTLSLMIGTAGLPHVIIRFFTVRKVADARKSVGWALVFIAILYTTAPAVGAMARLNLMQTVQTGPVGEESSNLAYENRPRWFKTWENTGLLIFEDKNNDGLIQYYNDSNPAFAAEAERLGWAGNEMTTVDRDIMVLANPEIAQLPSWVIALVAAGGVAAALSTAAGLLLAISSAISHDLLKSMLMPNISEKAELRAGRIAMVGAILVAGYLGINPPGFAAEVVALAFGLAASSLFPVLLMGIFYKRMNREGAIAGMLAGLVATVGYIFVFKGMFFIPGTNLYPDTAEYWLLGVQPESFGAIGAAINFIVAFIVCAVTPAPSARVQQMVEDIRVPGALKNA